MKSGAGRWLPRGKKALIGVIHLRALPGAPGESSSLDETTAKAVEDGKAWKEGGADAVLVENFGDAPFFADSVPPETVAAMTAAAAEIRRALSLPLGVNVLRNDGEAALAVAVATGADFIRVNVLTHACLTDQGVIQGTAARLLRRRRALASDVSILGDLFVKHGAPLVPLDPVQAAREMAERGGADGVIVTGSATGAAADPDLAGRLAAECPGVDLYIGSGSTPENVPLFLPFVRGFLVGTWCEVGGRIDRGRVSAMAAAIHRDHPR